MFFIKSQRTTLPFDGGLSPLTDRSRQVPLFGDTPLIVDIINGTPVKRPNDIHGRGSWGEGEDVDHSYKETGDEFMMDEKISDVLKRMREKPEQPKERFIAITMDGKELEFPTYDIAINYFNKNKTPYRMVIKKNAQNIFNKEYIQKSLSACFEIQSLMPSTQTKEIGAAFAIKPNIFLTCAHCVQKYNKMNMPSSSLVPNAQIVLTKQGQTYPAKLLAIDYMIDMALIQSNISCEFLDIGESKKSAIGTRVFAVGSPSGFENNVSDGIISSKDRVVFNYQGAPKYVFTDCQVFPGSSGGPLISYEDGKILGMMALIVSGYGMYGLNAAIPSEYLKGFSTSK